MINLDEILAIKPTLTPFGVENPKTYDPNNKFKKEHMEQIETCIKWLETKTLLKSINSIANSYSIKHVIERENNTYIANGCFIAAVIHLGIPYSKKHRQPNIAIPMSINEIYKNDPAINPKIKRGRLFERI